MVKVNVKIKVKCNAAMLKNERIKNYTGVP